MYFFPIPLTKIKVLYIIYNKHKNTLKVERVKADHVGTSGSTENDMVVSSMGFLLCLKYLSLGVEEAGNLEIPMDPHLSKNQPNKLLKQKPILFSQKIRKGSV